MGKFSTSICKSQTSWNVILKWILKKQDGTVWIGFIWLRTGTSDRLMMYLLWGQKSEEVLRQSRITMHNIQWHQPSCLKRQCFWIVSGRCQVWILAGTLTILTEVLCGFPQFFQTWLDSYVQTGHNHFLPCPFQLTVH